MAHEYKHYYRIWMGPDPSIIISDVKDAEVLVDNNNFFFRIFTFLFVDLI